MNCNKLKLPRELWLMILKIKTYTAVKNRLEKILKFHRINFSNPVEFECTVSRHMWCGFFSEGAIFLGHYWTDAYKRTFITYFQTKTT